MGLLLLPSSPFEGGYEGSIAGLIPRDVDFYASKNHLARAFDPFLAPLLLDEFESSPSGKALLDLACAAGGEPQDRRRAAPAPGRAWRSCR